MSGINEQLFQLYGQVEPLFQRFSDTTRFPSYNGPLLLKASERFLKEDKKLLIIGQETRGWVSYTSSIVEVLKAYEEFNLGEKYYSSPFWNFTRKIEKILKIEPYSCLWTNVSRYDVAKKRPKGSDAIKISQLDFILRKEIEIIKPDVVMFYTGPHFDERLKSLFNGLEFSQIGDFETKILARLNHKVLPKSTFRTYHPNYLRRSSLEKKVLLELENELNKEE